MDPIRLCVRRMQVCESLHFVEKVSRRTVFFLSVQQWLRYVILIVTHPPTPTGWSNDSAEKVFPLSKSTTEMERKSSSQKAGA